MARTGRPRFRPTAEQQRLVVGMAAVGVRHEHICTQIRWPDGPSAGQPIDPKTLRKHFADELGAGYEEANRAVAGALFDNATRGANVAAQIFWLKNRAPDLWKDRTDHLHGGEVHTVFSLKPGDPEADI